MTEGQFWIYMLAILLSPLIAVQVTIFLQRRQERRQRRLTIFKNLMSTRGSRLSPDHVSALNMIDVEFYGKDRKSRDVVAAWKACLDHLNAGTASEAWGEKQEDLLMDLLYRIALALDYEFDKTDLKRTSYFPRGYGETEADLFAIRRGLLSIVQGNSALLVGLVPPNSASAAGDELQPDEPSMLPKLRT